VITIDARALVHAAQIGIAQAGLSVGRMPLIVALIPERLYCQGDGQTRQTIDMPEFSYSCMGEAVKRF
jgi:hypothetical protein